MYKCPDVPNHVHDAQGLLREGVARYHVSSALRFTGEKREARCDGRASFEYAGEMTTLELDPTVHVAA